jgi:hypothetical protein
VTLNLESDVVEQLAAMDEMKWTPLQTDVCMSIAHAKIDRMVDEAQRLAELVRLEILPKAVAAEYLHQAAIYNQLYFEYGADRIQKIMAWALRREAAA